MNDFSKTFGKPGHGARRNAYAPALPLLLPEEPASRAEQFIKQAFAPTLLLLAASLIGGSVALLAGMPLNVLALALVVIGGLLGALIWRTVQLPIVPILRVLLLASLAFRLEINLFPLFKYNEGVPGLNISLMLLTSAALAGVHLARRWRGENLPPVFPLSFICTATALLLWCGLGVLASSETLLGFYQWWSLASCVLFAYAIASEFSERSKLRTAVLVIALMVGVNGVIGTLQATTGAFKELTFLGAGKAEDLQAFGGGEFARATGLQQMANSFAWFLVTLLPIVLAVLVLRVRAFTLTEQLLLGACAASGLLALVLTYARGSWLAFGVALALLLGQAFRALPQIERQQFKRQLLVLGALGAVLCLPFAGPILVRLTEDDNGSAYSRVPLSQVAQTIIAANPLLGVGLNNYEAEMRRYDHTPDRITDDFPWPVHNIILHTAAEAGLPALGFFALLLMLALREGWRAWRSNDPLLQAVALGVACGLCAFFITGLKELGSLGQGQFRLCFLSCGLLLALGRLARSEQATEPQVFGYAEEFYR